MEPIIDLTGIEQMAQPDVRGWLCFTAPLPEPWQSAEDSTQAWDREQSLYHPRGWSRPATDAERVLLAHIGRTVPADLMTRVTYPSPGVRRRVWPALEGVPTP